jgi:hypothetical protein
MISNRYLSELSDLESALEIVKKEADSKHTKIKDQNNIVNALQQEFAEENSLMKSHQLKVCFVNNYKLFSKCAHA